MFYPAVWDIVSIMIMALCASFFYVYGSTERVRAWPWPVLSFAVWAVIVFLFHQGILWQLLGQLALFAALTISNMFRKRQARIIK